MTPSPAKQLLDSGIPLTLLLDLADPDGPDSVAINAFERPAGDAIWLDAAIDLRGDDRLRTRHAG
jgi:hypothetical protein